MSHLSDDEEDPSCMIVSCDIESLEIVHQLCERIRKNASGLFSKKKLSFRQSSAYINTREKRPLISTMRTEKLMNVPENLKATLKIMERKESEEFSRVTFRTVR